MTTLATRMRELGDLEGFDVAVVTKEGTPVPTNTNGFAKFDYDRMSKSETSVSEWKTKRFYKSYPGYDCVVINADGSEAHGNSKLTSVRATYEAADD
jgi:hypothetical protein